MSENMTVMVRGWVGNDLLLRRFDDDKRAVVKFRLAVPLRRRTDNGNWQDIGTRWYTVKAWDRLAENIGQSIVKGHPVVVVGRPSVDSWLSEGEARGELVISAQCVGHDLTLGTASFTRGAKAPSQSAPATEGVPPSPGEDRPEDGTQPPAAEAIRTATAGEWPDKSTGVGESPGTREGALATAT